MDDSFLQMALATLQTISASERFGTISERTGVAGKQGAAYTFAYTC